ncbi:MAG: hypothetical protein HFG66_01245 [Hungatella sp.]|nr:hypothetical protein [Hungatella sp.]
MQVEVKAKPMSKIPDDMNLIQKRINTCMLELTQVRRDLETLSGLEEPIRDLKKQEKKLEQQTRYSMLFGNTICQICRQYVSTENNIIDYSENVRRKAQRESLSSRNLKDLYPLFNKVIFSEGGD